MFHIQLVTPSNWYALLVHHKMDFQHTCISASFESNLPKPKKTCLKIFLAFVTTTTERETDSLNVVRPKKHLIGESEKASAREKFMALASLFTFIVR